MPKFAANLSMLFTEHPFLERFARAKAAGFQAVEFLFPYEYESSAIAHELRRNELEQVLFNLPAGDFTAGDRGMANDPNRVEEFRAGVHEGLKIAAELALRTAELPGGAATGRRARGDADGDTHREPALCRRRRRTCRCPPGRRAAQRVRRSWLLSADTGVGVCPRRTSRASQSLAAIRHLSRPAHERESGGHDRRPDRPDRSRADRRQSRPKRARDRGDQLSLCAASAG